MTTTANWSPTKRTLVTDGFLAATNDANSSLRPASAALSVPSRSLRADANNAATEQLLETMRLTVKDLVRDLLGINSLPFFFRNFEEKMGPDSADADTVLDSTARTVRSFQQTQQQLAAKQKKEENAAAGDNNNKHAADADAGENGPALYAGIRAIALVPTLRRSVDAICIAAVDRLFNLIGPEVSMAQMLHDRIASLNKEVAMGKEKLQSRLDLALQQRTELIRELQGAYEQHQMVKQKHEELHDKCKLLAEKLGKSGVADLFRGIGAPEQRANPRLKIPVEPVNPQTGTLVLGAQIKQITDKLEAQWDLLEEVDRVHEEQKEQTRDHVAQLREMNIKINRQKQYTYEARQSEETLKEEVQRLQAKLRQSDLMLRAKEHDVELAVLREREVAAGQGRDGRIQQLLAKQQERDAKMRRAQRNERLLMTIADKESHMRMMEELFTSQSSEASTQIRRLESELKETKAELKSAREALFEGVPDKGAGGGGGDKGGGKGGSSALRRTMSQSGGRVTARTSAKQRLEGTDLVQKELQIQQLQDQLKAERQQNERVLGDKEKRIRDRDAEIAALRDSVSKSAAIQMAIQSELDALVALERRKRGNSQHNSDRGGAPSAHHSVFSDDDSSAAAAAADHAAALEEKQQTIDELEQQLEMARADRDEAKKQVAAAGEDGEAQQRQIAELTVQIDMMQDSFTAQEKALRKQIKDMKRQLREAIIAVENSSSNNNGGGGDGIGTGTASSSAMCIGTDPFSSSSSDDDETGEHHHHHHDHPAAHPTSPAVRTVKVTERLQSDVDEIARLTSERDLLKQRVAAAELQLNDYARKFVADATKKYKEFGCMVTPIDILHGHGGGTSSSSRRQNTLSQRPIFARSASAGGRSQQQQSSSSASRRSPGRGGGGNDGDDDAFFDESVHPGDVDDDETARTLTRQDSDSNKVFRRVLANSQSGSVRLGRVAFRDDGTRVFIDQHDVEHLDTEGGEDGDGSGGAQRRAGNSATTNTGLYDANGRRIVPHHDGTQDAAGDGSKPRTSPWRASDPSQRHNQQQRRPLSARPPSTGPTMAGNRSAQLRMEMAARTRHHVVSPRRAEDGIASTFAGPVIAFESGNSDVGNAMDGLVRQAAMQAPPAWIDMTEVVVRAQKFLQHPPPSGNNHPSQNQQSHPSLRHHHYPPYSQHMGRCHDLRLGLDDASTQTDDVIVVEPSHDISVVDMMRPFSTASSSSGTEDAPWNPTQQQKEKEQEAEFVALLVRCHNGAAPVEVVGAKHHPSQRRVQNSGAPAVAQPGVVDGIGGGSKYRNQGPIVAKLQVPPLMLSFNNTSASKDTNNNDGDDDEQHHPIPTQRPASALSAVSSEAPFGSIGRASIVPHSFGTAQLTGGHVAEQLQTLLKKALTQWSNDVMAKAAAAAAENRQSRPGSAMSRASGGTTTPRPRSALGGGASNSSCAGGGASRPRTPLHIPVNPVNENIEHGAARPPWPKHPIPPEAPMVVVPTRLPTPMEHVPDAPDRKYAISHKNRAGGPTWFNSLTEP